MISGTVKGVTIDGDSNFLKPFFPKKELVNKRIVLGWLFRDYLSSLIDG